MKLRLKHWRERRAMSIRDLSDKSKVSSATIVAVEKTGNAPRPNVIRRLAAALDVTLDELIDDSPATLEQFIAEVASGDLSKWQITD